MKIPSLKEFAGSINDIYQYLISEHNGNLQQLVQVLRRLSFEDNFESFEVTVTIPATSEIAVENKLKVIPSKRIIVRAKTSLITDGATEWTKTHLYIQNGEATEQTVTILFIK